MNNLRIIAFTTAFLIAACASTDNSTPQNAPNDTEQHKTASNTADTQTDPNQASGEVTESISSPIAKLSPEQSKQFSGLYFARLPCPGCGKVRVNLVLEANQTYEKTEEYLKSNELFFDSGTWGLKNGKLLLLPSNHTPSNIRVFRTEKNALILLTEQGKPFPGKPEDFRFKKK